MIIEMFEFGKGGPILRPAGERTGISVNIRHSGPTRRQVRAITYLIAALLIGGIFLWQTVSLMGAVKRTYSYLCSAMDVVFAQEA